VQSSLFAIVSVVLLAAPAAPPTKECALFVAKLETCTAYQCVFVHTLTGEKLERRIVEYKNGRCSYVEQMPNGGRMECSYTDSVRKAVTKYYQDVDSAAANRKSVGTSVHSAGGKTTARYTIDGKEVENPLAEAMANGQCKISGYGVPKKK
jgi:hypothetical protein